jgi:hypothetical protein
MNTIRNTPIESLIEQLGAPDPEQRWLAFVRLSQQYRDVTAPYLAVLHHPNALVRQGAVRLLTYQADAPVREVLFAQLDDADPRVRIAVANALSIYPYRLRQDTDWTAADLFIRLLSDPAPEVRCYATQQLMADGLHTAVPALIPLLQDSAVKVREVAILALGIINDPQAIPALRQLIETDRGVTTAGLPLSEIALTALTWIGQPLLAWKDLTQHSDPDTPDDRILPTDLLPGGLRLRWGMDLPECLARLKAKPMYVGTGYFAVPLYLAGHLRGVSFMFENPDDRILRYTPESYPCDSRGNCYNSIGQRISGDGRVPPSGLREIAHTLAIEGLGSDKDRPSSNYENLYEQLVTKYRDALGQPTFSGSHFKRADPDPAMVGDPTSPTYSSRNFDYPAWDWATRLTYWDRPEGCVKIGFYEEDQQYSVEIASQRAM